MPEDKNVSKVGWLETSLCRSGVVTFHHEHSATVLSSQLISDSIAHPFELGTPTTHPNCRPAEKCELTMSSVIATYLTIAAMLALTTFPVLVPAIITAGHAILRRTAGPARAATYQPTASRRLAVRRRRVTPARKTRWTGRRSIGFFAVEPRRRTSDRRATRVRRRAGRCRSPGRAGRRRGPRDTSPS